MRVPRPAATMIAVFIILPVEMRSGREMKAVQPAASSEAGTLVIMLPVQRK
jgi:hypothetical protein